MIGIVLLDGKKDRKEKISRRNIKKEEMDKGEI